MMFGIDANIGSVQSGFPERNGGSRSKQFLSQEQFLGRLRMTVELYVHIILT